MLATIIRFLARSTIILLAALAPLAASRRRARRTRHRRQRCGRARRSRRRPLRRGDLERDHRRRRRVHDPGAGGRPPLAARRRRQGLRDRHRGGRRARPARGDRAPGRGPLYRRGRGDGRARRRVGDPGDGHQRHPGRDRARLVGPGRADLPLRRAVVLRLQRLRQRHRLLVLLPARLRHDAQRGEPQRGPAQRRPLALGVLHRPRRLPGHDRRHPGPARGRDDALRRLRDRRLGGPRDPRPAARAAAAGVGGGGLVGHAKDRRRVRHRPR